MTRVIFAFELFTIVTVLFGGQDFFFSAGLAFSLSLVFSLQLLVQGVSGSVRLRLGVQGKKFKHWATKTSLWLFTPKFLRIDGGGN